MRRSRCACRRDWERLWGGALSVLPFPPYRADESSTCYSILVGPKSFIVRHVPPLRRRLASELTFLSQTAKSHSLPQALRRWDPTIRFPRPRRFLLPRHHSPPPLLYPRPLHPPRSRPRISRNWHRPRPSNRDQHALAQHNPRGLLHGGSRQAGMGGEGHPNRRRVGAARCAFPSERRGG